MGVQFVLYDAHSETVMRNRLRMYNDDNFLIRGKKNHGRFSMMTVVILIPSNYEIATTSLWNPYLAHSSLTHLLSCPSSAILRRALCHHLSTIHSSLTVFCALPHLSNEKFIVLVYIIKNIILAIYVANDWIWWL